MSNDLKKYIQLVYNNKLDSKMTSEAFDVIMSGNATDGQIGAFLIALQINGINKNHVLGALDIMQKKMIPVKVPKNSIDTCGTGGDGIGSLNVSTATAFVVAGSGIPIAKHGNKALTSKCGSADVLEALNIKLIADPIELEKCINEINICFMFAPFHHPAMKYVGKVRQEIGIRTIFNMLGPLLNPGKVNSQLVGVFSEEVQTIYGEVLTELNRNKSIIVTGGFGMDEININGENKILVPGSKITKFNASSIGIENQNEKDLDGGDASYNANRIKEIFTGKKDSFYEIVLLNSAFALSLSDTKFLTNDKIKENYMIAKDIVDSGIAMKKITQLTDFTQSI